MLYCFYLYIAKAEELETVNTERPSQSVFCLFIQFPSPFGVFFKRFQSLECHRAKIFFYKSESDPCLDLACLLASVFELDQWSIIFS